MNKAIKNDFNPVKSAERVFDILEQLIKYPDGLIAQELGQNLQIAGSSLHALIQTMQQRKYIKIGPNRKIMLGNKFYEFVNTYANEPLLVQTKPIIKALAQKVNENVHLAILEGLDIIYIACEQTKQPIRYHVEVGQTQKAHVTGVGKMLLSQYSNKAVYDMYTNYTFEKLTDQTITSTNQLIERLEFARSNGYSLDEGEAYTGSKCYAAPIYDEHKRMIASLSISIPFIRVDQTRDQEMITLVQETCKEISNGITAF